MSKHEKLRKMTQFNLSFLTTEEGVCIKKQHFTKELRVNFQYKNRDYVKIALHATSKVPNDLTDSQIKSIAMAKIMKSGAEGAVSILTCGNCTFVKTHNQIRYVPNWQVQYVFYSMWSSNDYNELSKKEIDWEGKEAKILDIFVEWGSKFSETLNAGPLDHSHIKDLESFAAGHHNILLENDYSLSDDELRTVIEKGLRELKNHQMPHNAMNGLNKITKNYLIAIGKGWGFAYAEENIRIDSPVRTYYFKYSDLSNNLTLKLKWSLYGYFFFNSIIETLDDPIYTNDISFAKSIKPDFISNEKKIFLIDDFEINDFEKFK